MPPSVHRFDIALPRYAFSPRDAARAGDLWRCFQEAAVEASSRAGWSPQRYRDAGTGFVVRSMRVVHHREAFHGEQLTAATWVSRFRRDMFSTREVRLESATQGLLASATQEWVHVKLDLTPLRASPDLIACFPLHEGDPSVQMPSATPSKGALHAFSFRCWHTWMDPLGHVNHPAYVDFCDEATSTVIAAHGISPVALVPVAEEVTFRSGVTAGDEVTVETQLAGRTNAGDIVLAHRILKGHGIVCADATTVRRLATGSAAALFDVFAREDAA